MEFRVNSCQQARAPAKKIAFMSYLLPSHSQTISRSPIFLSRSKSTVPLSYAKRTHLRRPPSLPQPMVPHFAQLVIFPDGSSFTHYTTSPRSVLRVTRDVSTNALWNPGRLKGRLEGEDESGRMGRWRRKFGEGVGEEEEDGEQKNV
jgi:hypothetical protein